MHTPGADRAPPDRARQFSQAPFSRYARGMRCSGPPLSSASVVRGRFAALLPRLRMQRERILRGSTTRVWRSRLLRLRQPVAERETIAFVNGDGIEDEVHRLKEYRHQPLNESDIEARQQISKGEMFCAGKECKRTQDVSEHAA